MVSDVKCCNEFHSKRDQNILKIFGLQYLVGLLVCLEAVVSQRLVSKVPASPLEPVADWVWGRLINGLVYRAGGSHGGASGGKSPNDRRLPISPRPRARTDLDNGRAADRGADSV